MMRRLVLLCAALLCACSPAPTPGTARLRVSVTTTLTPPAGTSSLLAVSLEGGDGQALSGALASVTEPGGALSALPFDPQTLSYRARLAGGDGIYQVTVDSAAAGVLTAEVPVLTLSPAPALTDLQDGLGARALSGARLSAATPIRVEWSATPQADRYLVDVRQRGVVVWSGQSTQTSLIVPAGTLQGTAGPGVLSSVTVTASALRGDTAFRSAPFLSVSSAPSGASGFQVGP